MKRSLKSNLLVTLLIMATIILSLGLFGCAEARGHRIIPIEGYAPTCDQDGLTAGEYCDRCGKFFVEQQVIQKLGHDYKSASTKAPNCTEDGHTEYKCSRCGDSYLDDYVASLGHDFVRANCTRCNITDPEIFLYEMSSNDSSTGSSDSGSGTYTIVGLKIDYVPAIINVPESYNGIAVTAIGDFAFYECYDLISVTIPSSIEYIGYNAFVDCYKLVEVINHSDLVITKGTTSNGQIAKNALVVHNGTRKVDVEDGFVFGNFDSKNYLFGFDGDAFDLALPGSYGGAGYELYKYAFYLKSGLNSITLGGVTKVGDQAFFGCQGLVSITVSSSVTKITDTAFGNCVRLAEVINLSNLSVNVGASSQGGIAKYALEVHKNASKIVISGDFVYYPTETDVHMLKYIGSEKELNLPNDYNGGEYIINAYAFYDRADLTKVIIGDNARAIGKYAFSRGPESVEWSENTIMRGIGEYAFSNSYATSIILPETITSIYNRAFENCKQLVELVIPDAVISFGQYVFSGAVPSIKWGKNPQITQIGKDAFNGYNGTSIVLPETITSIGNSAFANCKQLPSLSIPNAVTSIGQYAFKGTASEIVWGNNPQITEIGIKAFSEYNGTEISIPNSVITLGESSFSNCSSLTSVQFGNSAQTIGVRAFENCSALLAIDVPDSTVRINGYAFNGCKAMTKAVIGDGVKYIYESAFRNCEKLAELTFGNSVEYIGFESFIGCKALNNISIPNSTTYVDERAFFNCTSLYDIEIGDYVTYIGTEAFKNTKRYNDENCWTNKVLYVDTYLIDSKADVSGKIEIVDGTLCIACDAFANRKDISEVIIPESVVSICKNSFKNCDGLTSVVIPNNVAKIEFATFNDCDELRSVTLGNSLTSIEAGAFYSCDRLVSVIIPDSVKVIDENAFMNCYNLTSVTLGKAVSEIKDGAFDNCYKLVEVINNSNLAIRVNNGIATYAKTVHKGNTLIVDYKDYLFYTDGNVNYLLGYKGFDSNLVLPENYGGEEYELYRYTFVSVANIQNITIPASVVAVGELAFYSPQKLTDVYFTGTVQDWCAIKFADKFASPMYYGAKLHIGGELVRELIVPAGVRSIGQYAFRNCDSLTSIYLADSVTAIGMFAFDGCDNLADVRLGAGVSYIGQDVFTDCPVKRITAPISAIPSIPTDHAYSIEINGGSSIDGSLFRKATNLVSLTLASSVESIAVGAFSNNYRLAEIINHSGLPLTAGSEYYGGIAKYALEIHDGASKVVNYDGFLFYTVNGVNYLLGCEDIIGWLYLPDYYDGAEYEINQNAFLNCTDISKVVVGEGVTKIHANAFANCKYLSDITIPNGIEYIEKSAFEGCSITNATMPAQVIASIPNSKLQTVTITGDKAIGIFAFDGVTSLRTVKIENSVPQIGASAFANCTRLANVTIGSGVQMIHPRAFQNCTSLKKITIPSSVEIIGVEAFKGCTALSEITLNGGLKIIAADAFAECEKLAKVNFYGSNEEKQSIFIALGNECLEEVL